jgi:hypothetical protein
LPAISAFTRWTVLPQDQAQRAINGALELDGARLVWQLASEQGWIPGDGMCGHRISVQLGKASLRVGGKGIHAIAESTVWACAHGSSGWGLQVCPAVT